MPIKTSVTLLVAAALLLCAGCTLHHSKSVLPDDYVGAINPEARFISEDDAGLAILSLLVVSEPDHYAVLLERARRKCENLHHVQIDFYTDIWLFVSFPIVRLTAICDPPRPDAGGGREAAPKPLSAPAADKPAVEAPVEAPCGELSAPPFEELPAPARRRD